MWISTRWTSQLQHIQKPGHPHSLVFIHTLVGYFCEVNLLSTRSGAGDDVALVYLGHVVWSVVRTKISYNSRFSLNAVLRKTSKGEYCHMRRYNETSGVRMNIEHAVNDSQATS